MFYVVWDLDGVLIDSAACVRDAYRAAGCTPPDNPLEFWSHAEWCDHDRRPHTVEEIYRVKDRMYLKSIADESVQWLPGMMTAYGIRTRYPVTQVPMGIYSAAPHGSIDVVKHRWGHAKWPFSFGVDGMAYTPHKMKAINALYDLGATEGVYIDDRHEGIHLPDGWRFIHYEGQDVKELELEIGLL